MATKTKQKTSFKDRIKAIPQKIGAYGQKYKSDLQTAYSIGYNAGLQDGVNIPHRFGTRSAAVIGYNNGISKYRKNKRNTRK